MESKIKKAGAAFAALTLCVNLCSMAVAEEINETITCNPETYQYDITTPVNIDGAAIEEGGKFRITYTGDEASIVLVLIDNDSDSGWYSTGTPSSSGTEGENIYIDFDYSSLMAAVNQAGETIANFADIDQACVTTWGHWNNETASVDPTTDTIISLDWINDNEHGGGTETNVIYETALEQTIDAADLSSWPWTQFDIGYTGMVYPGAVIEYDVETKHSNFTSMYLETDISWKMADSVIVNSTDFDNNTYHIAHKYSGEAVEGLDTLQIKTGGSGDYADIITIKNLKITNGSVPENVLDLSDNKAFYNHPISFAAENEATYRWYRAYGSENGTEISGAVDAEYTPGLGDLGGYIYCVRTIGGKEEKSKAVPVYSGSELKATALFTGTNIIAGNNGLGETQITNTKGGAFNTSSVKPFGYFKVSYTGGENIQLALSHYESETDSKWAQAAPSEVGEGYAVFDYAACVDAYGSDFSNLDYISVVNLNSEEITVTGIEWIGYPVSYGELGEGIAYITSYSTTGTIGYLYTEHVGGEFRAQDMKTDSYFYIEYKGSDTNGVNLAVTSVSGSTGPLSYAVITPSESGALGSGYYCKYTIEDVRKQFGDNFARLDQINILCADDSKPVSQVTAYYFAGTGEDVEKNKADVSWANKTHKGIAIIGDSIVHNPLCYPDVLAPDYPGGDWNALLGRNDVDNYGIGGETTVHISNRFNELLKDYNAYNKIIIWCGINDTGLVQSKEAYIERVTGNYKKMLDEVKTSGKDIKIYMLSILPTAPNFYDGMQDRITGANDAMKQLCDEYDFAEFVNVYDCVLYTGTDTLEGCTKPGEPHADPSLFMDGLHPILTGYKKIAAVIKDAINDYDIDITSVDDGTVTYTSSYTTDSEYDLYVAVYDSEGRLLRLEMNKQSGTIEPVAGAAEVKAFFWTEDMQSLAEPVVKMIKV